MTWLESLILGIIQGLTEFLPVSSSGHLELAEALFGIEEGDNMLFAIAVHGGTMLSTIVVFRRQIWQLLTGVSKFRMNWETQFVLKILISCIPILIVGLIFEDKIEVFFGGNLLIVGLMLLVTAILLWFSSVFRPRARELGYRDAFIIGLSQAVAVVPGLSRSGTTISTGLLLGVKREEVAPFSFLMVLIPILGANLLKLAGGGFSGGSIGGGIILIGFFAAFITGTLACRIMLKVVEKGNLKWFALYCIAAGVFAIVWNFVNAK